MNIKEKVFNFISTHEAQVSNDIRNRDGNIDVKFTTFGNRAGCRALIEVIEVLDDKSKLEVLEMMENRRVLEKKT